MATDGPRIEIVVDKKGGTTTTAFGIMGGQCHVVTEPYESLFGAIVDTVSTTEAYEDPELVEIKSETR